MATIRYNIVTSLECVVASPRRRKKSTRNSGRAVKREGWRCHRMWSRSLKWRMPRHAAITPATSQARRVNTLRRVDIRRGRTGEASYRQPHEWSAIRRRARRVTDNGWSQHMPRYASQADTLTPKRCHGCFAHHHWYRHNQREA